MLLIRRLLQFVFCILCIVLMLIVVDKRHPDYVAGLPILGVFILIIVVLGPWWPSEDKTAKWRLNLPTDNPRVAAYVLAFILALYAFYSVWETYENPSRELSRVEKLVASITGIEGVMVFKALLGIACLLGGIHAYRKSKSA